MAKNIEPKLRKIGEYLKLDSETIFVIPEYQRPYSWEISNCDKLWQDIVDFTGNKGKDNYFFGTVIINCSDEDRKYELIDGQQRTTTFLLLIKALLIRINFLITTINDNDNDSISLLNGLKERRRQIIRILYKAETEDIPDRPNEKDNELYKQLNIMKNESINENDQMKPDLNIILQSASLDEAERKVYKKYRKQKDNKYSNFFRNFKFFYWKICDCQQNEVNNITKSILENCEIIEIKSWQVEQAITMFNSLNSDGMPLNDADIISAKLIAESQKLNDYDSFAEHWQNLKEQVENLSGSISMDSILNQYMYLTRAKNGEMNTETTVPGVRRYYTEINRKNIIGKPIETVSKMSKLAGIWCEQIKLPAVQILLQCNENAKLFLGCFFSRYLDEENEVKKDEIKKIAETMLRLFVILELSEAGYSSRYFKSFLFKEAKKLTDKNVSIDEIVSDFNSHIKNNFDRSTLESYLLDYDKNSLVYVNEYLFAKEKHVEDSLIINERCNVEHIMPVSGKNHEWIRKDAEINDESEFNNVVDKLGNKILLEEKTNKSIGNAWFRTKVTTSYKNSSYPIAHCLADYFANDNKPYWTKNDIEDKTKKVADRFLNFIFN